MTLESTINAWTVALAKGLQITPGNPESYGFVLIVCESNEDGDITAGLTTNMSADKTLSTLRVQFEHIRENGLSYSRRKDTDSGIN